MRSFLADIDLVSFAGPAILAVFVIAYVLVFVEEKLHLRKSKPVMVAAGLIWILAALAYQHQGRGSEIGDSLRHVVLEYAELLLFLLSAMSFVNAMVERNVFEALRARLGAARVSVRGTFWITGTCAFFLSPVADNLTTALVMGTVVLSSLSHHKMATAAALVGVVVAANAGGAFSPFGDITTLMVWQKGKVEFFEFFVLFVPALVNWLIPAVIISLFLPREKVEARTEHVNVRKGGLVIAGLFLGTIATTVYLDHSLNLPPFLGMMMGLGVLNLYGYFLHGIEVRMFAGHAVASESRDDRTASGRQPFNIFHVFEKLEWDTLLFFYGIMLCVGGLGAMGYLESLSKFLYSGFGATAANVSIGVLSAIVDNIPLTYAVLIMDPHMDHGQWLLITLTAGVGGSLLSIGSAAGVALMGIGRGSYTFFSHLKWTWAILLGYAASVGAHLLLNAALFTG
jgi:Na+/H+ antiporter NhaD/arsenite permease-like protein